MIPYDDLVVALASWRARQGLPVMPSSGVPQARAQVMTPTVPRPAVQMQTPTAMAAATPMRAAPPHAPPRGMPLPAPPQSDDFDDAALVEDPAYDPVGEDYVVALGVETGEPTAIGGAPEMPRRGKRPHDW